MRGADDSIRESPLVERLIHDQIRSWLDVGFYMARDGASEDAHKAIDELEFLHLSGIDYGLVPRIAKELRRAGLLKTRGDAA